MDAIHLVDTVTQGVGHGRHLNFLLGRLVPDAKLHFLAAQQTVNFVCLIIVTPGGDGDVLAVPGRHAGAEGAGGIEDGDFVVDLEYEVAGDGYVPGHADRGVVAGAEGAIVEVTWHRRGIRRPRRRGR